MQVWELMRELSKIPAGTEIVMSRGEDTFCFELSYVDMESSDACWLVDDGSETDDPKHVPN